MKLNHCFIRRKSRTVQFPCQNILTSQLFPRRSPDEQAFSEIFRNLQRYLTKPLSKYWHFFWKIFKIVENLQFSLFSGLYICSFTLFWFTNLNFLHFAGLQICNFTLFKHLLSFSKSWRNALRKPRALIEPMGIQLLFYSHLEICPEMHAIANIANIADLLQKSQKLQISQTYCRNSRYHRYYKYRRYRRIIQVRDSEPPSQILKISQNYSNEKLRTPIADIADIANIADRREKSQILQNYSAISAIGVLSFSFE